mgnify:CR=1 FL=1
MKGMTWVGLDALQKALVKKMKAEGEASKVMKKHGGEMQRKAMKYAPVDTGYLKGAIDLDLSLFKATVESTAKYAVYQEYGTRYQPGTPHIRPAFTDTKKGFIEDMKKVMK